MCWKNERRRGWKNNRPACIKGIIQFLIRHAQFIGSVVSKIFFQTKKWACIYYVLCVWCTLYYMEVLRHNSEKNVQKSTEPIEEKEIFKWTSLRSNKYNRLERNPCNGKNEDKKMLFFFRKGWISNSNNDCRCGFGCSYSGCENVIRHIKCV